METGGDVPISDKETCTTVSCTFRIFHEKGVAVSVPRPSDYNPSLAAALGLSQPNPRLNLSIVGLSAGTIGGIEGPDRLFVGGLPSYFTETQIKELLESFGSTQIKRTTKGHQPIERSLQPWFNYADAQLQGFVPRLNFEVPAQLHNDSFNDAEVWGNEVAVVSKADTIKLGKVKKSCSEAEIKKLDYVGRTVLHRACFRGKVKKAKYLIYQGVVVDALDTRTNTALHYAAGLGREKCVELLIKHGADVELKNVHDKTPYEIAVINSHTSVIDVMKKLLEKNVE